MNETERACAELRELAGESAPQVVAQHAASVITSMGAEISRLRAELTEPWGPAEGALTMVEPVRMARIWLEELTSRAIPGSEGRRSHIAALLYVIDGLRETNRRLNVRCQDAESSAAQLAKAVVLMQPDVSRLRALEAFGVDNWDSYEDALRSVGTGEGPDD